MKKRFTLLTLFLLTGCAHHSKLSPEVGSDGAKAARNGVVYLVPEINTLLKMKLVSLGLGDERMLHLRIYFLRKSSSEKAFLNPKEQFILLPESRTPIYASKVRASGKSKPIIQLLDADKHAVELLFSLPRGGHDYPFIEFHWKLHYTVAGQDKVLEKTERYSSVDNYNQHASDDYSADGDFPYEEPWLLPEGWIEPDFLWW